MFPEPQRACLGGLRRTPSQEKVARGVCVCTTGTLQHVIFSGWTRSSHFGAFPTRTWMSKTRCTTNLSLVRGTRLSVLKLTEQRSCLLRITGIPAVYAPEPARVPFNKRPFTTTIAFFSTRRRKTSRPNPHIVRLGAYPGLTVSFFSFSPAGYVASTGLAHLKAPD